MLKETEVLQIKITDIIPDPNNPRKDIGGPKDWELECSVKEFGIIQPIMIRPLGYKGQFMVVYGHRRFEAAKANQFLKIACIVKEMTDEAALEYQIIENLQRKGINPMEESNAFHRLLKKGLSTAEMIADKLGVSTKYVYDRLALQRILPEVQEAVMKGIITITHGKQFARLPLADQTKLLKSIDLNADLQVSEIRTAISSTFKLNLDAAVFDLHDTKLVQKAGSCMKCKKRTGCNLILFEEVQMADVCLDSNCYESKVQAYIDEQLKAILDTGKIVKLLSAKWVGEKEGLLNRNRWQEECEGMETGTVGIIVEYANYGNYKLGQVINLRVEVEKEEEVTEENNSTSVKSSIPHKSVDYRGLFAEKCINAVLEAYHNVEIQYPVADNEKIITSQLSNLFYGLDDIISDKIAISLNLTINCDTQEFKEFAATLILNRQLELLSLLQQISRIEDFEYTPEQADIEAEQDFLHEYDIDFFKIAADLNAPYKLFTPTEIAEATEA